MTSNQTSNNSEAASLGIDNETLTRALDSGAIIKNPKNLSTDSPPYISEISSMGLVTFQFTQPVKVSANMSTYASNFI